MEMTNFVSYIIIMFLLVLDFILIIMLNSRKDSNKVSVDSKNSPPTYEERQAYLKTMYDKLKFLWEMNDSITKKPLLVNIDDRNFTIVVKACKEVYGYDRVSGNYILGLRLIINDDDALTIYKTTYAGEKYSSYKHQYIDFYSKYVDEDIYDILNVAYDIAIKIPKREKLL